jgi:apolipoprotein N-acyltransferase
LVQPNIPQTVIWDESRDDERIREVLSLSERALAHPTDLLVWPEAAVPKLLRWDRDTFDAVTNLAGSHHVWMIVGADDMTLHTNSNQTIERRFYNSSFLISPEGDLAEGYRKRALVIFGEYIPLVRWLPFLKWFTPIEGGFTPGTRSIPFPLANLGVKTSVLICYEDIFPHLGREYAADDVDVLVNITNNGWFGEAAAQWQHAACAVFRAVENGLPLIRCCNNGLTCWVDAQGRIGAIFQDEGSVYHAGFMTAQIPLPVSGQLHARTIYNQYGDWFGWLCVIAGALMVSREIVRLKWRKQKSTVP